MEVESPINIDKFFRIHWNRIKVLPFAVFESLRYRLRVFYGAKSFPSATMYYELFAIARITDPLMIEREASKIASTVGKLILSNRGVIRDIHAMGARPLPKIMSKEQERHFQGYHFVMGFDASAKVQSQLLRTLRSDPRILRANIIKRDLSKSLNPLLTIQAADRAVNMGQ